MTDSERQLVDLYLDGALSESEHVSLFERLEGDADAASYLPMRAQLHVDLRRSFKRRNLQQMAVAGAAACTPHDSLKRVRLSWPSWRPLAAAAAGILLGIFCTSVVFAYVAPSLGKVITLLEESFESGPSPLVTGLPIEAGRWSGDYTEVVGEQQGVKPASGGKMLRFLRADYEGETNAKESRVADIYRLIDMRPYRQEFAAGSAVAQLSAGFNAFAYSTEEIYSGRMTLHAFAAETLGKGALRTFSAWDENCLSAASTGAARLDRNPATWQRMITDLRVPANTDFLLIHLMIPGGPGTHPEAGFGGHYIDDVRLTLRHSPLR